MSKTDRLVPSTADAIKLSQELHVRFIDLTRSYFRVKGEVLVPPESMNKDMILWRTMFIRHATGDFRSTRSEELATRLVAQWTLDEQCDLRNQPRKVIQWVD